MRGQLRAGWHSFGPGVLSTDWKRTKYSGTGGFRMAANESLIPPDPRTASRRNVFSAMSKQLPLQPNGGWHRKLNRPFGREIYADRKSGESHGAVRQVTEPRLAGVTTARFPRLSRARRKLSASTSRIQLPSRHRKEPVPGAAPVPERRSGRQDRGRSAGTPVSRRDWRRVPG